MDIAKIIESKFISEPNERWILGSQFIEMYDESYTIEEVYTQLEQGIDNVDRFKKEFLDNINEWKKNRQKVLQKPFSILEFIEKQTNLVNRFNLKNRKKVWDSIKSFIKGFDYIQYIKDQINYLKEGRTEGDNYNDYWSIRLQFMLFYQSGLKKHPSS